ncbi:MAG: NFACT RNA binding domain-containing protein [Treponema sp.]|jgi:predicted ribosome quality control (RQC) complex YloA/Tae2 family protein|nr:NFACT RNA binding domain-containing protein [Treponema sp.]
MSLNWKEIDLILSELDLEGLQIQKAVQSAFDVLALRLYGRGASKTLLFCLSPGAVRLHETFRAVPKSDRPLRFAEFLNSRVVNGRIESAGQLGDNRIVRIVIRRGDYRFRLYARLWSNAANIIVTDKEGMILDAMRRLPRRGEKSGGRYAPEASFSPGSLSPGAGTAADGGRSYEIREFPQDGLSFNEKIDAWYAEHGGMLSLEKLREQARKSCEGGMGRIAASLERLREKEAEFSASGQLREYGDIILANQDAIREGDEWLEAEDFYRGGKIRIKLDPGKSPAAQAEAYYGRYRKAKSGGTELRAEIEAGERELAALGERLSRLLEEDNPLVLQKLIRNGGTGPEPPWRRASDTDRKRPGLSFRRRDWLIMVGRDARENDALLRRHVKGNDIWLHARDYPGAYVFIKQHSGKTVPLDILLDAGNLAIFYSRGRNGGEGDLFYTPVKYLRRVKNGKKGLVIPAQEKNLHIKTDPERLAELENCRIEK